MGNFALRSYALNRLGLSSAPTDFEVLNAVVGEISSLLDKPNFDLSKLHEIVGDKVPNAALYHHQAIDEPGEGLTVSAYSPDGIVQAVEVEGHPFGIAVQWHPEQTLDDLRLFEALVKAATPAEK